MADYRMTGMTLDEHPMELLRPQLDLRVVTSADIQGTRDGAAIRVAGMVTARQRPATAKGVVFMLLEDEHGVINLVVPPPVAERCRLAVRTAGFVIAHGRLEHREGTTNVVVTRIERLEREGGARAQPASDRGGDGRPNVSRSRRLGRPPEIVSERDRPGRGQIVAELAAALPPGHAFGRRGR